MPSIFTSLNSWWHETVVPALLNDGSGLDKLTDTNSDKRHSWRCAQGCVRGVRPWLVVLVLLITALWLPLDLKFDGFVPGAKDGYKTDMIQVKENLEEVVSWHQNQVKSQKLSNTGYSCPCSYDMSGMGLVTAPYVQLELTPAAVQSIKKDGVTGWLDGIATFCRFGSESGFDNNTAEGRKAADEAWSFLGGMQRLAIQSRTGPLLLTKQAWHYSRLVDASSEYNLRRC